MSSFNQVEILSKILKPKVIANAKINQSSWAGRQKINLSPSIDFMCPTKAFFNFKYSGGSYMTPSDDEFSYENERAKVVGNQFHDYVQSTLRSSGVVLLEEATLIDEEHHIKARLDLVVEIEKQLYLVELKSAKQYAVKMMRGEGAPNVDHQKQLQLYFHLYEKNKNDPKIYEKLQGRPINRGILFYEEKDNHKITEFLVPKNQKMIKDLMTYADMVWNHVVAGKKPDFKFEPDSPECMFKCSPFYYELCHGKAKNAKPEKDVIADGSGVWGTSEARTLAGDIKFV